MARRFSLFDNHLEMAHELWRNYVSPGDLVVDATCGNGYDTEFLVRLGAQVVGCDCQEQALCATRKRVGDQARLLHSCHSTLAKEFAIESLALVVFNLGYLPGGNKELTTKSATTLVAVKSLLPCLKAGGLMSITCYPGHEEGAGEEAALLLFASSLPPNTWSVSFHQWRNRIASPSLLLIQKSCEMSK